MSAVQRVAACVLLFACAMPYVGKAASNSPAGATVADTATAEPVIATAEETRAILAVVLPAVGFEGMPPPPPEPARAQSSHKQQPNTLLLADESICLGDPAAKCDGHLADAPPAALDGFVPRRLFDDLLRANVSVVPLDLSGIPGTAMVRSSDLEAAFAGPPDLDRWAQFHRTFPGASGVLHITRPVLSADRSSALLYVTHHCGGLCGAGLLVRLERSPHGWRVVEHKGVWVS
ncbi:hypothetical protein QLQ15_11610 [Lysobacter sp. LF1]|uniref:SnoaL-like domain-containing protein n=1 Tax=Lysobacter stagni TaxID=3045172 RepID=A0ABT6XHB1_9GAMM|nr:hypothetical protein [Lysobacter sp. LF1]MDI9239550.1 hypothetical protein [Lysobacter sp. LF1]